MATPTTQDHQDHEIECYVSVLDRIQQIRRNKYSIPVKMNTTLSTTLTQLFNSPAISFCTTRCEGPFFGATLLADISLTVGGDAAGTFGCPDVEKILEKCHSSSFGKGDKTVMDWEYRNGKELAAKDIIIADHKVNKFQPAAKDALYTMIEDQISRSLFGGRSVKIGLYKLAVYEKDGHFDWHRDTTHGVDHHATVLVALNTEWTGGNLGLRHQQTTVDVDLHPMTVVDEKLEEVEDDEDEVEDDEDEVEDEDEDGDDGNEDDGGEGKESEKFEGKTSTPKLGFQIIAFYTDIEHKVGKIMDGTRIVLQFDVNVEGGRNDHLETADLD